jgi:two-component system sensor histidine kinase VicK
MSSETKPVYPASLLLDFAEHEERLFFAFDLIGRRFVYLNPTFESFFSITTSSASIDDLLALVHPEDEAYLKQTSLAILPGEFKSRIEFRVLFEEKKYSFSLSLFYKKEQDQAGIFTGCLEDITAFKEHNDTLNELSNKKNAVLNILSHDLAGPLGSIKNLSTLLSRKTRLLEDPEVGKWISMIEKISKKGIHLIQEFVKQEFMESAGAALLKKRTDLAVPVKTLLAEHQQSEKETGITFHYVSSGDPVFVEIDEAKFIQVINNLISNAIKFTPNGGTITVGLEEKQETVLITVADTGIGIPQKFHAGLFDKFNDARRTGLKGEPSVGLGMSIIKMIIDWHEGRIWFDSEENKGTTFYIEIAKTS